MNLIQGKSCFGFDLQKLTIENRFFFLSEAVRDEISWPLDLCCSPPAPGNQTEGQTELIAILLNPLHINLGISSIQDLLIEMLLKKGRSSRSIH